MTGLYIVGGVLLFFILLLLSSVHVRIRYEDELFLRLRFWFIRYTVPMTAQEAEDVTEAAVENDQDESLVQQMKDLIKKRGVKDFLGFLRDILLILAKTSKEILKRIKLRECTLRMTAAGGDAAETAVNYGKACSIVYPAVALLFEYIPCRKRNIEIKADFMNEKSELFFEARLKLRLGFLLKEGIKMLIGLVPLLKWFKGQQSTGKTAEEEEKLREISRKANEKKQE